MKFFRSNCLKEAQELVKHHEEENIKLKEEKNHLIAIVNALREGVVITNGHGETIFANPSFQSLFFLKESPEGKTILECIRNKTIHDLIKRTLQKKIPNEEEIKVFINLEEKYFIIHTSLIDNGCVVVFYDVTRIRKLEETRREFIANVSHELKTPLTNIKGYAETLLGGALNDSSVASQFVKKIEKNAVELQNLVEDIMELSRIESGNLEMKTSIVDLSEAVKSMYDDFCDLLKTKKLTFKNLIEETFFLKVAPKALKQILSNLLDNAVKYTPRDGIISISAEKENNFCYVFVTDTGNGIPEKDLNRIFERFYQVDKPSAKKLGGTGLGLAIVKHLVQAHGGMVNVKNNPSGGAQFSFTLPLANKPFSLS